MSNQPVETVTTSGDKMKVALAIFAVVAGIVGFYFLNDRPTVMRVGVLLAGLLIAIAIAWTSTPGREFIGFAKDSARETKKVVWPARKEALQLTAVVFGFVLLMALYLWGIDKILQWVLYDLTLGWR